MEHTILFLQIDDDFRFSESFVSDCYLSAKRTNFFRPDTYKIMYTNGSVRPVYQPIPIGSIPCVSAWANKYGIVLPLSMTYSHPVFFKEYSKTTLDKLDKFPVFIKPVELKRFDGVVVDTKSEIEGLKSLYKEVKLDEAIYSCHEIREFASEWRVFVHKQEIFGVQNYMGDCTKFPNLDLIHEFIATYEGHPIAYSFDVGFCSKQRKWFPIEINDFYSLGSYGCNADKYLQATIARWRELGKYV